VTPEAFITAAPSFLQRPERSLTMRFRKVPGNNKRMDTLVNLWENCLVNMSNKAAKYFVYPDSTAGSKAAKRLRTEANKLSERERESLFKRGMQIIYGGTGKKEAVGARH